MIFGKLMTDYMCEEGFGTSGYLSTFNKYRYAFNKYRYEYNPWDNEFIVADPDETVLDVIDPVVDRVLIVVKGAVSQALERDQMLGVTYTSDGEIV